MRSARRKTRRSGRINGRREAASRAGFDREPRRLPRDGQGGGVSPAGSQPALRRGPPPSERNGSDVVQPPDDGGGGAGLGGGGGGGVGVPPGGARPAGNHPPLTH